MHGGQSTGHNATLESAIAVNACQRHIRASNEARTGASSGNPHQMKDWSRLQVLVFWLSYCVWLILLHIDARALPGNI
jgi:hypothetical protein